MSTLLKIYFTGVFIEYTIAFFYLIRYISPYTGKPLSTIHRAVASVISGLLWPLIIVRLLTIIFSKKKK